MTKWKHWRTRCGGNIPKTVKTIATTVFITQAYDDKYDDDEYDNGNNMVNDDNNDDDHHHCNYDDDEGEHGSNAIELVTQH